MSGDGDCAYAGLPEAINRNIVGLLVKGFCLEPEIREGDVIFIELERTPSSGNIVLCHQDNKTRLMRYLDATEVSEHDAGDCCIYGVVIAVNRKLI